MSRSVAASTDSTRRASSPGRQNAETSRRAPAPTTRCASPPSAALRRIARRDLPVETAELARWLIGRFLCSRRDGTLTAGRIVETEAYAPGDASSHAFRGETARNRSMFLPRGFAYVYMIYGTSLCVNVASERRGVGAAVLIRALEPTHGVVAMHRRRTTDRALDLARGPGRLTQALAIGRADDGADLCSSTSVWLAGDDSAPPLGTSPRIGITREIERPARFFALGSPFVSGPRRLSRSADLARVGGEPAPA